MPDAKQRREFRHDLDASAVGWMFPIAIGLCFRISHGLDNLFHPWPCPTAMLSVFRPHAAFLPLVRIRP